MPDLIETSDGWGPRRARRPALACRAFTPTPLAALLVALLVAACSAPDPLPKRTHEAPPGRPPDGLLGRADLQAVAAATLARDGAALIHGLAAGDAAVRARAAFGLASVQDPAAVGPLTALLDDPDARVRADAAFALGQTPGGVGPALVQALGEEADTTVRRLLVEAIGKAGGEAELAYLRALDDPALLERATLSLSQGVIRGHAPAATLDLLIERMTHPDPDVRPAATYFVARTEPAVWWDRRLDVRGALASLASEDPAAMYLLTGLGRRMDVFSRTLATRFLVSSSDWRIRANAASALAAEETVMPVNAQRLVAALDDPSPHVRLQAAAGLAGGGPDRWTVEALTAWLEAHPADQVTAGPLLPFLAQAGEEEVVLERIRGLPADRPGLWTHALEALALLDGEAAVRETGRLLRDPAVPDAIARRAADELVGRWELSRTTPAAPAVFLEVAAAAAEGPRPARALALAPVLTDPLVRDRGGEDLLRRLRARVPGNARPEAVEGGGEGGTTAAGGARGAAPQRLAVDWEALGRLGPRPRLVLETEEGTIVLRLRTEEAPLTVQAVAALAEARRYDGTPFHRVVPNFVIQGGDVAAGDGSGGPGFVIRSELGRTPYLRGVLGMASSGKDTEGSQFFVTHAMQPHLDGGYTAFGWVERGMEIVDVIVQGDRVLRARVISGW